MPRPVTRSLTSESISVSLSRVLSFAPARKPLSLLPYGEVFRLLLLLAHRIVFLPLGQRLIMQALSLFLSLALFSPISETIRL